MQAWGDLARQMNCYLHVDRVNTARRIRLCQKAGAASFDGTSISRFATTIERLDSTRRHIVPVRPVGGEDGLSAGGSADGFFEEGRHERSARLARSLTEGVPYESFRLPC